MNEQTGATFSIIIEKTRCGPSWNVTVAGRRDIQRHENSLGSTEQGVLPSTLRDANQQGDERDCTRGRVSRGGGAVDWVGLTLRVWGVIPGWPNRRGNDTEGPLLRVRARMCASPNILRDCSHCSCLLPRVHLANPVQVHSKV